MKQRVMFNSVICKGSPIIQKKEKMNISTGILNNNTTQRYKVTLSLVTHFNNLMYDFL